MSGPRDEGTAVLGPQQKLSRYRSLRGKSVSSAHDEVKRIFSGSSDEGITTSPQQRQRQAAPVALASVAGNSIARSMSRYRRRSSSISGNVTPKITVPLPPSSKAQRAPVPAVPTMFRESSPADEVHKDANDFHGCSPDSRQQQHSLRHVDKARQLNRSMADHTSLPSTARNESRRRRLASRDGRGGQWRGDEEDTDHHEHTSHLDAERDSRLIAEGKKKDLQRLHVGLANSHQNAVKPQKPRSPVIEKFVMLTKGRKSKDNLSPGLSPTSSVAGSVDFKSRENLPEVPKVPTGIEQGGKGIVPQTDAPISAVNAGDRIVSVRCKHHTFVQPVKPDTTPVDVVFDVVKQMTYNLEVSPSNCVVFESYGPLGLERRIRRFEHIRDVMNSWDRDTHNHLIVLSSAAREHDEDLELEALHKSGQSPTGVQIYMYHSNRPGKWSKRWITLLDNGQIICSKKQDARSADGKDTLSLCHLSDYDIYKPTESQMRRHLKPPKKHCFAIKSQHKPAMFLNTDNYVQYFCTDDPKTATQFLSKIQGWRSWYLLERRPAPRRVSITKTGEMPSQLTSVKHVPKKSVNAAALDGNPLKISVDETPYAIGEFEPLIDLKRFDKRLSQFGKDFIPPVSGASTMPKQIPSHLEGLAQEHKSEGALIDKIKSVNDDAFTGNGLLGQGYENRKAAAEKGANRRQISKNITENTFMDVPSFQNEASLKKSEANSWFPSAIEHSAKSRDIRPNTSAGVVRRPSTTHGRRPSLSSAPPLPRQAPTVQSGPCRMRPEGHPHPLAMHHPSSPLGSPSLSSSNRRQAPKPLVNLTPEYQEPPQFRKKGHGVQAPEGLSHLVDLISVGNTKNPSGLLEVPPRNPLRRGASSGPLNGSTPPLTTAHRGGGLARTRSKSQGAPAARPMTAKDAPPMPPLHGRLDGRGDEERTRTLTSGDREYYRNRSTRENRSRGRERAMPEYNSGGRTGTMKVV